MSKPKKELKIIPKEFVVNKSGIPELSAREKDIREHIRYPLYFECYVEALRAIFEKDNHKSERKLSDSPDNANNIIAFCGERGTGKTTAISEFGEILETLDQDDKGKWWISQLKQVDGISEKRVSFTVLDSIDASLMTEKEDIIEMILTQMYERLEERSPKQKFDDDSDVIIEEILCNFNQVYLSYHRLSCEGSKEELGDSVASILRNSPTGPKIRKAFSKLLYHFLRFFADNLGNDIGDNVERYLVITIDDLDLNVRKGYEILEQIHKYLSDVRIIVLLAVDFGQLSKICSLYFEGAYQKKRKKMTKKMIKELFEDTAQLGQDYLAKAIPIFNRVYLPDRRTFEQENYVETDGRYVEIKEYIMKRIAEKMGIYYDVMGKKGHFAIPTTVRELVSYDDFLDSLYSIDWEKYEKEMNEKREEEQKHITKEVQYQYHYNHVKMNRDITNRMAYQLLNFSQLKTFQRITERTILRRAQYTIETIDNWMQKKKEERIDNKVYRYGDLLQKLYDLGRENYNDQVIVHCVLAFLTSEMTKEYYTYKYERGERKKEAIKRLDSLIGASFGNRWLMKGRLHAVRLDRTNGTYWYDFIEKAAIDQVKMIFDYHGYPLSTAAIREIDIEKWIVNNKIVEIIDIFLTFIYARDINGKACIPDIIFEFKRKPRDQANKKRGHYECQISFQAETAEFDILGCMGRVYDRRAELAEKIFQGITGGIMDVREPGKQFQESEFACWKGIISAQLELEKEKDFLIFPYYNLDLAYNVLKRVRGNYKRDKEIIGREEICNEIRRIYGYIAVELYKEDKKYNIVENGFYQCFVKSDFIQRFGIIFSDKVQAENTEEKLQNITGTLQEKCNTMFPNAIMSLDFPKAGSADLESLGDPGNEPE